MCYNKEYRPIHCDTVLYTIIVYVRTFYSRRVDIHILYTCTVLEHSSEHSSHISTMTAPVLLLHTSVSYMYSSSYKIGSQKKWNCPSVLQTGHLIILCDHVYVWLWMWVCVWRWKESRIEKKKSINVEVENRMQDRVWEFLNNDIKLTSLAFWLLSTCSFCSASSPSSISSSVLSSSCWCPCHSSTECWPLLECSG